MMIAEPNTPVRTHQCQRGAAAVEFAFVFPLLLFVIYSTVVYGYVFFLQQTVNLIAQESAKAAVAVAAYDPTTGAALTPDYSAAATAYFNNAKSQGLLSALPAAVQADFQAPTIVGPTSITSGGQTVGQSITITVQVNNVTSIFPQIGLPGIGTSLPPLPSILTARATVQVS